MYDYNVAGNQVNLDSVNLSNLGDEKHGHSRAARKAHLSWSNGIYANWQLFCSVMWLSVQYPKQSVWLVNL